MVETGFSRWLVGLASLPDSPWFLLLQHRQVVVTLITVWCWAVFHNELRKKQKQNLTMYILKLSKSGSHLSPRKSKLPVGGSRAWVSSVPVISGRVRWSLLPKVMCTYLVQNIFTVCIYLQCVYVLCTMCIMCVCCDCVAYTHTSM